MEIIDEITIQFRYNPDILLKLDDLDAEELSHFNVYSVIKSDKRDDNVILQWLDSLEDKLLPQSMEKVKSAYNLFMNPRGITGVSTRDSAVFKMVMSGGANSEFDKYVTGDAKYNFDGDANYDFKDDYDDEICGTPWNDTYLATTNIPLNLATSGSAGHDVTSPVEVTIEPGKSVIIDTGICFTIDEGFYVDIRSRSGLAFKHDIHVFNGVLDSDFKTSMGIKVYNRGTEPYTIMKGERFAQLLLLKYYKFTNAIINSNSTHGGFGSTGKF